MYVDDSRITLEKIPANTTAGQQPISSPPAGSVSLYVDNLTNHISQIDENGVYIDLCYPSFVRYFNWQWDCEANTTAANIPGWQMSLIGTGTSAIVTTGIASGTPTTTQAVNLPNHPGVLSYSSSTTANSGVQVAWGANTGGIQLRAGLIFDCMFFPVTFANTTYRFGFTDSTSSADSVDGVYFEINGSSSIVAKTAANSVRTTGAATGTLTASAWYHARIYVNSLTSAVFYIYDEAGAQVFTDTITTNIPSGAGRETLPRFIVTNSSGVATFLAQIDFIGWRGALTRGGNG